MSSPEKNRKLIEAYIAAANRDRSEATLERYIVDPALKEKIKAIEKGMPNYQLTPQFMIAEGNKVAVYALVEAVHREEFLGIPPTGKKIKHNVIVIYEIENNKIVNHWMEMDTMALMNKLTEEPIAVET